MNVVYRKTVSERLTQVIERAASIGREIEYIDLTPPEWHSLKGEMNYHYNYKASVKSDSGLFVSIFNGVELRSSST